jgi:sec-independent protein translocase protein TatB
MLDVGFSEILLTSAIALIVLGPERLPKVARQVGNWMGRARAMARQLSEQLEREVNADELLKTQSKSTYTPPAILQPVTDPLPAISPPSAVDEATEAAAADLPAPAPREPDPVFGGLPPSATTPAAMHAADPPVAASKPPHE